MLLPNDIETLLTTHFKVVPNERFKGAWAIKYPCGFVEPVTGTEKQVKQTLLSMDSRDLQIALHKLSDLQSSLLAIQNHPDTKEYSPKWLQASREQFALYDVVFDLEIVKDYLDNNK